MPDYNVVDSSIRPNPISHKEYGSRDAAVRIGIVREERQISDGTTRYIVEVFMGGNQVPVSCTLMSRFGGPYNFEEWKPKAWARSTTGGQLPPTTAGTYDLRDGDQVLVAFIDGKAREGVILGGIGHPAREEKTTPGELSYISAFNGIEHKIGSEGDYTVTFNGAPLNDQQPSVPGSPIPPVQYDPAVAGSFYGFDSGGSFTVSDGSQTIKINKDPAGGSITIESGRNSVTIGGTPTQGEFTVTTDNLNVENLNTAINSSSSFSIETLQMGLKSQKVAIGNDVFELFAGLSKLIDALGTLIVTSPVGSCTPLNSAPTWAAQVVPIQTKIKAVTGSL